MAKLRVWALGVNNSVSNDAAASDNFKVVQTSQGDDFLRFTLNAPANASVSVFSSDGRSVLSVPSASYAAGLNEVRLGSASLQHGLYFVRFISNNTVRSVKYIR